MARKRVTRSAGVKAKVAVAAVSGDSPAKIASRFGVHPTQVATQPLFGPALGVHFIEYMGFDVQTDMDAVLWALHKTAAGTEIGKREDYF